MLAPHYPSILAAIARPAAMGHRDEIAARNHTIREEIMNKQGPSSDPSCSLKTITASEKLLDNSNMCNRDSQHNTCFFGKFMPRATPCVAPTGMMEQAHLCARRPHLCGIESPHVDTLPYSLEITTVPTTAKKHERLCTALTWASLLRVVSSASYLDEARRNAGDRTDRSR